MQPLNVVLYQGDAGTALTLVSSLSPHVRAVHMARTRDEIRPTIARHRAEVLVLDLETSCLSEVERLHHEFPKLSIVCTHRLADEELWADALQQGASDMCEPRKTDQVVASVLRERVHHAAA
jgi:DNA-binding NtrC family response regulator